MQTFVKMSILVNKFIHKNIFSKKYNDLIISDLEYIYINFLLFKRTMLIFNSNEK